MKENLFPNQTSKKKKTSLSYSASLFWVKFNNGQVDDCV